MKKYISIILIGCMLFLSGCQKEEQPPKEEKNEPRVLNDQEISNFTEWLSSKENYGFLLSEYKEPQEINFEEVFYTGAGLETVDLTEEQRTAYLQACEWGEISGDLTALSAQQIRDFVLQKTGIPYEDAKKPLSWIYLSDYDLYLHDHGDTNYIRFTCVGGEEISEGIYQLQCIPGDGEDDLMYYFRCLLTLKKNKEDYQFYANQFVEGFEEE